MKNIVYNQENHHPDKINKPDYTVPIPRKEHQKIHNIEPNINPLTNKMREYYNVNKMISSMKIWSSFFKKDFGYKPDINLKQMLQLKYKLIKELKILVKNEMLKIKHIKGFGVISLAGILAYAHPSRFPSLRKFLFYCGYTKASGIKKNYCRRIKPIMHQLVTSIIMRKNLQYYNLYIKIKGVLNTKDFNKNKKIVDIKARNRIATLLLKEIYVLFKVDN